MNGSQLCPKLNQACLKGKTTGKVLGKGSYGSVIEVKSDS